MIAINKDVFKQIFRLIKSYNEIVIARHIGPDPDAVASALALKESIKSTFPNKKVYAIGAGVSKFKYLGIHDKLDYNSITNALLIVVDVPNFIRVDGLEGLSYSAIVKIDHHPAEDIKGDADFTSSEYSSASEMVAELIYNTKLVMNKSIAEKLYAGIVADSERFLFTNTTANTFKIASNLIKDYKVDFNSLYNHLYERSISECKFESYIVNNLNINENGFGYIIIKPDVLKEYGADISQPSVIINNFNYIKELLVWCFITYDEKNEIYKVSLRSRGPVINEVASHYHGGGHKLAAGARIFKEEEITSLLNELDSACKEYNEKNETKEDQTNI